MKLYSTILFAAALFLVEGCAMDRIVIVETNRIEVESPQTDGLKAIDAEAIFRDVATQLEFTIKGPFRDPRTPDELAFSAGAIHTNPKNSSCISMSIEGNQVSFVSEVYGSAEDFIDAQKAAALYEQELDRRGIHYKVSTRKGLSP